MKKSIKYLIIVALVQLILHGIWEYVQCGIFYTMEGQSSFEHNWLMIRATLGDVGIALVLLLILSFVNYGFRWLLQKWGRKEVVISILYALFVSFFFEVHALYNGRWGYSQNMPLVPGTNIGLLPVVQLVILLPLGFKIAAYIIRKRF